MGHIVFDFDGTLINSMEYTYDAVGWFVSKHLGRPLSREEFEKVFSAHHEEIYPTFGLNSEEDRLTLWKHWMDYECHHRHLYELFPGVVTMIRRLQKLGHIFYLWTARDRSSTLDLLRQVGIINWFKDIRCGDDGERKPHPEGLQEMLSDINKEDIIMVGDGTMDIEGAKQFGVASIGAIWSRVTNRHVLTSCGASYIAETPHHCLEFLLSLPEKN